MIRITTPRLIIRDHQEDDLSAYHNLLTNATVMRKHSETSQSLEQTKERLERAIEQNSMLQRKEYFFCIEDRETVGYIGEIGLTITDFTPAGKLAKVGYFIHNSYWGQGYTTEALRAVVRYAFEEIDVYRISAGCLKENKPGRRVLDKTGFVQEGDFKEYQWHDGKLKDRVFYRLLRREWIKST